MKRPRKVWLVLDANGAVHKAETSARLALRWLPPWWRVVGPYVLETPRRTR